MASIEKLWNHHKVPLTLAALAVAAFNNWLLALVLNPHLFLKDGSVSEFSVPTQPYSWVFRATDIISGLLFLALSAWVLKFMKSSQKARKWLYVLAVGLAVFGVANGVDGLLPLNCSDTANSTCQVTVALSLSHIILPSHAYSSVLIAVSYFLLPLASYKYARANGLQALERVSLVSLGVSVLSFVTAIHEYVHQHSLSVHTAGFPQEAQMLIIGWWLLVLFYSIRPNRQALKEVS
jgi:hypothetical membrane protein